MHQSSTDFSDCFRLKGKSSKTFDIIVSTNEVAQLVEALRYKPERRGFDSQWCLWNFSLT
jgi:hypothetical protein